MISHFSEYRDVQITEPLRQGDVLEAVDPESTIWTRYLFVITADCDFANQKNAGRITCVPLLPQDAYLQQFTIPRLREKLVAKPLAEIRRLVDHQGFAAMTTARLRDWLSEEDPEDVLRAIGTTGSAAEAIKIAIQSVRLFDANSRTLQECITRLVEAQLLSITPPKPQNAQLRVMEALASAYEQTPGDAMFLGAIGPDLEGGYFSYLRHIEQVNEQDVALGPATRSVTHRRVSRIQDRYIHALSQRFAMVFMSIGLPTEYESTRRLHFEMLGESLQ